MGSESKREGEKEQVSEILYCLQSFPLAGGLFLTCCLGVIV